ncbi:MAG TPA: CDP-alcohol phosphatidyltransferase family protein [Candidatus Binatia bacterium]|nr:CDP-alcohol phosphatidyltransferase family protein [Candidatus Binatia bacterium]
MCRPGTAAVAIGVIGVTIALALRGIAQTPIAGPTGTGGPLIGPRVRAWYRGLMEPFEEMLAGLGVSPDALTYAQLVVSMLAGGAFAAGCLFLAGWLTILAGTLDILDGGLARRAGVASPRGALVDSVADRWAEFGTFVGLGAFFRHDGTMLFVVALAAFASQMVSYVRARAEGLGVEMTVGRAQRPERYLLLGFGAWVSSVTGHLLCPLLGYQTHVVLASALIVLAVVATWTALERGRHAAAALRAGGTLP